MVNDDSIAERNLARADAIGAWVCWTSVVAAVVLVVVYGIKG
jgi:hypothetical protein